MVFLLTRYSDNGDSTQGLLHEVNDNDTFSFQNYTLEDEFRDEKVFGETCIPEGMYEIKFREVLSDKTKNYRAKFSWFTWHLELQDVPNFKYIYIHLGNKDEDTNGCILVQDNANNNQLGKGFNSSSTPAFGRFYRKVSKVLNSGECVFIQIKNLD